MHLFDDGGLFFGGVGAGVVADEEELEIFELGDLWGKGGEVVVVKRKRK